MPCWTVFLRWSRSHFVRNNSTCFAEERLFQSMRSDMSDQLTGFVAEPSTSFADALAKSMTGLYVEPERWGWCFEFLIKIVTFAGHALYMFFRTIVQHRSTWDSRKDFLQIFCWPNTVRCRFWRIKKVSTLVQSIGVHIPKSKLKFQIFMDLRASKIVHLLTLILKVWR